MPVFDTRPRIWVTPDVLPALKAKAVTTNDRWNTLLTNADRAASWDIGIVNYAMAHLMTGKPEYVSKAWDLMSQSMAAGTAQVSNPGGKPTMGEPAGVHEVDSDSGYQCRNYFVAACCLLDWCWPALNDTQRQQLITDIETCADWVWPETNPSRSSAWAIDNPLNNYWFGFLTTWLAGLALAGVSPKAQGYVDNAIVKFRSRFLPQSVVGAWTGGYSPEGTSYGIDSIRLLLLCLQAHHTATGEDLSDPTLFVDTLLHLTAPDMTRLYPGGDQTKSSGGALQDPARTIMLIATDRGDVRARIWLDSTIPNRDVQRISAWEEFLFYPGTPAAPTGAPRSSPAYYFASGTQLVSSRSDWAKDAIQLIFQCGPTLESHQDRNQGHFMLFRGDWLCAMAKLATRSGIAQGVEDSNCVSFGKLPQSWTQDTAKITVRENTDQYTYLVGDLAGAYAPGNIPTVGHYTRGLFFLKPNMLLVRDEFALISSNDTPVFHLHTLGQPVIDPIGFVAISSSTGTKLFGSATSTPTASAQKQTPDQPATWRLDFPADATGGFCVALEAAPISQGARTITPFVPPRLRGAVLGKGMAAFVSGELPLTYKSPGPGNHYLLGLNSNFEYLVNGVSIISSAAGVIVFSGAATEVDVTVSESGAPPPPPPLTKITDIQDANRKSITEAFGGTPATIVGTGFGTVAGSVTVAGLPASVINWDDTTISVTLPKLPAQLGLQRTGPVTVIKEGTTITSSFDFTLTSAAPPPPPPPKARTFIVVIPESGTPTIKEQG